MKFGIAFLITALIATHALPADASQVHQLSASQFNNIIKEKDGILLDVRTEREFNSGHLENSGQLNFYAPDFAQSLLKLPKDKPIYLYCNTGSRSNIAAQYLIRNGYTQVYNLQRGIMEWHYAELPVVVSPNASADAQDGYDLAEFRQLVSTDQLVLIDFYAPWCGPCMQMMPMIDDLTSRYEGRVQIVKINADASRQLMRDLRLTAIPFLALFQNGEVLFQHRGVIEEEKLTSVLDMHYNNWRNKNSK